jgi:hypothetical protein
VSVKPFSYGKNKYMLLGIGSKDCCRTLGERHRYKIRMKKKNYRGENTKILRGLN